MAKRHLTEEVIPNLTAEAGRQTDYFDTSFRGGTFGIRVTPKGHRSWILLHRPGGRLKRETLGSWPLMGLSEARQLAIDQFAKTHSEKLRRRGGLTFGELVDRYLADPVRLRKRPRSAREEELMLKAELLPRWASKQVGQIRHNDVAELMKEIGDGRHCPTRANRVRAVASQVFNYAIRHPELLPESFGNPCLRVAKYEEKSRDVFLDEGQIRTFWNALEGAPADEAAFLRLILITGQRPGEVAQMSWPQLELRARVWRLPPEVMKNGRPHTVPLSSLALKVLLTGLPAEGRLFDEKIAVRARRAVVGTRSLVGISYTPADLRRTAARHLNTVKVPGEIVARILSYRVHGADYDYAQYGRLEEMAEALERWSTRLKQIVSVETTRSATYR